MKRSRGRPVPRVKPKAPRRPAPSGVVQEEESRRPRPRALPKEASLPPAHSGAPSRFAAHVAPLDTLAESTVAIAEQIERAVLQDGKRADRSLAAALRHRRDLAAPDHRFISQAVFSLFRWRGWLEPLGLRRMEARLLLAVLLDSPSVHPVCRVWGRVLGRDPARLLALGDAPSWPTLAEGFRRLTGGQPLNTDPWRLFPPWLREHLPLPPGNGPPKIRFVELLRSLQARPPLWVRVQGAEPEAVWGELKALGVKPWVHRRVTQAARLEADVDVHHLPPFVRGHLEIQDLASQAVALTCDPDPGERWWDACAGAGGKALHLAALMKGKGLVVATDVDDRKLKETIRRARKSPFRNLTTKHWDGHHVAGKPGKYDGVLVDAPCSAIGTWRRNPDARWTADRAAIPRLAQLQAQLLHSASAGVRPGGTLVYSVCTLAPAETQAVVAEFLEKHPAFRLEAFTHPLADSTTIGTLLIWPQEADTDAMFLARMIRMP